MLGIIVGYQNLPYSFKVIEIIKNNKNYYSILKVKSFNELLEIEEEIREPILMYYKNNIPVFCIINKNIIYQIVLNV